MCSHLFRRFSRYCCVGTFLLAIAGCSPKAPAPAQNGPDNNGAAPSDSNGPSTNAATANPPIAWTAQADPGSAEVGSLNASYPLAVTPRFSTDFPLASQPYALHLNGKEAELRDLRTGQIVGIIRDVEALPNRPAISPDGTAMAAKLLKPGDDHIRIWSFTTGRIAGDRIVGNKSGPISIVKFSKPDQLLGIRSSTGDVVVMDLGQAAQPRIFPLARPTTHARLHAEAVGVSPTGKYLAAIMGDRLVIHDLASGNCVGTSQLPGGALDEFGGCKEVVFSLDGKHIAALCTRSTANWLHLLEWNAATGELIQNKLWNGTEWVRTSDYVIAHDEHPLTDLPDGSGWAIFGRLIWKRGAESPEIAFPSDNDPHPRCLLDNDRVVARAAGEQGATSLQLLTRAGAASPPTVATNTPKEAASGSWQATADRAALVPRIDPKALAVFGNVPHVPRFSQRPSEFAAGAIRDEYVVFDLRTGAEVKRFQPSTGKPQPVVDISLDGRYLVTAAPLIDENWKFEIWDVSTGKLALKGTEKIGRGEQTLEFLNNRELLIAHSVQDSSQRRYAIWDIEKQQRSREFTSPATAGYLSASHLVSPGGRWAIATSTSAIEVFDLTSGKLAGTAPLPLGANRTVPSRVVSAAMSVDGAQLYLVLQYSDKEAKLITCDIASGKLAVRPVDNARLNTFWDNETVVWFSPWLVEDCNWLVGKQAAINIVNGAIIGPLGLRREATVLSLPKNQIYVGHTPIDLVISPAAALTAITVKTDAAGNIAKDVESLRPKPVVAVNNPKPKPIDPGNNQPMPPAVAPPDDPTNKPPAWTATVDPMLGAKPLVAAKQFDVPIARNTRFITSDRGGNFIAVMDENEEQAQVLDLATGKAVGKRFAIPRQAGMATIDPSGAYVAFSTDGDELTIQAVQSGEAVRVKRKGSFVDCHYLSFAADQKLVAAFENDHRIELLVYKPTGGEPEKRIALDSNSADWAVRNYGLAISPGGRYLAALSYHALEIHDLQGSAESQVAVVPFANTKSQVITFNCDGICFSPDGKRLAATYTQGQQDYVTLWNMDTGEPVIFRPSAKRNHLRTIEHSDYGPRLAWFEDSETLLYTGTMLLDAATGCPYWVINQDDFDSVLPLGSRALLTITSGQDSRLAAVPLPQQVSTARTAVRSSPAVTTPPLKAIVAHTAPPANDQIRRPPTPDGLTTDIPQRTVTLARIETNAQPMRLAISPTGVLASELVVDFIDTSKPVITSGPLTPEREVTLELFDIASGKSLHRLPVPERSRLLDISPDGSLLLTGDALFGSDGFSRLDVWAPKLGKHAVGWQPLANTTDFFAVATWAAFIDKRQVLVQSSQHVTLWQLPECKPLYSLATNARPILSPNRKQFFDRTSGLIRDALTGEALVKLAGSQPTPPTALIDAIYAPDGNSIVGVLYNHMHSSIVRWNTTSGEIVEKFGTPPVPSMRLALVGKRGLLLLSHPDVVAHGVTLIDLKQRQIVAQYRSNGAHAVAPDGTLWLANTGRDASYIARGLSESDFEWPQLGATPSYAVIAPGSKVAIDFQSNLPEAAKLKPAFEAKLKAAGFTIDASATTKAVLVANQDRTIVQAGPPEVSIPAVVGRLAIVDGSGTTAWEIKLRERNDNSVKFDTANWLNGWTIPSEVYKTDWQKQIATKEFPAAKP